MQAKLRALIFKYPLISALLIMIVATLLTEIHFENMLTNIMEFQSASYLVGIVEQGLVGVLLVVLLSALGMMQESGFTHPEKWKSVWLVWPIIIYSVLNGGTSPFDGTMTIDTSKPGLIVLFVLLYFAVGFFEEILFRSTILPLILRKWGSSLRGVYFSVLFSNVIFGILHLVNLIMGRETPLGAGTQIIYAMFFGVFFAACFLRNHSIWPVVFAHALFDLCGNFEAISVGGTFNQVTDVTPENALITVVITLPLFLYGLFLLRKVRPAGGEEPVPAERLDAVAA